MKERNIQIKRTALLSVIFLLGLSSLFGQSQIDSLIHLINSEADDTTRIFYQYQLLYAYDKFIPNKTRDYANSVIDSIEENNIELQGCHNYYLGKFYSKVENFHKSNKYLELAKKYFEQTEHRKYIADCYYNMGLNCYYIGLFARHIEYMQKCYNTSLKYDFQEYRSESLLNLSTAYSNRGEFTLAYEYLEKAKELAHEAGRERTMAYILNDLGNLKNRQFEYEQALDLHFQALEWAEKMNDHYKYAHIMSTIGCDYLEMDSLDKALHYLLISYELVRARKETYGEIRISSFIGWAYLQKQLYDSAYYYYKEQLQLAYQQGSHFEIYDAYGKLSHYYGETGDFEKAYESLVNYKLYRDSVALVQKDTRLTEIMTQFEADNKARKTELLSKDNEIKQLRLRQRKRIVVGLLIVFGVLLLIAAILIHLWGAKTKQKIAEKTQQNLRQQMNPHFIFNTLNSIQYYIVQNNKEASNSYLIKFAKLMRMILSNSEHPYICIQREMEALGLYLELEKLRFKDKLQYQITVDEAIDIYEYKIPTLMIQPFVENAILHGVMPKEEKGHVSVGLKMDGNSLLCVIEDDGIGREKALERKKQKDGNTTSLGTRISEDRLVLINSFYKERSQIKYVDLKDSNNQALGTRVEIRFPVMLVN